MRRAPRLLLLYAVLLFVTAGAFTRVSGGFIPTQDKQYLFSGVLLPEGATLDRTETAMRKMADAVLAVPGVRSAIAFPGLNAIHFVNTPNIGTMFIGLDSPHDRELSAAEINSRINGAFSTIADGLAFSLMPPPVLGLGNAAGFEMYVQDRAGLGYGALWELDLFGQAGRAREALAAAEATASAELEATRIAVVGEVAHAYFALRAEQVRLAVQYRQVANLQEGLRLLEILRDEGRGTQLDVARSTALGLAIASALPLTEAEIARQEQRLATLTAQPTASLREVLGPSRPPPELPELIPVGDPESWLRRRPDIAAAEQRLASATAAVGVEVADYFPQVTLTGNFGWTAQAFPDLGSAEAERYAFGPALSWSFLDFGRVRQRVLAAEARAEGALAAYEETVLLALEEVESSLANWRAASRSAGALTLAVERAREALELARLQFEAGAVDTLVVLDAERTLLDLEDQHARAVKLRATALAALYKALAGDFAAAP